MQKVDSIKGLEARLIKLAAILGIIAIAVLLILRRCNLAQGIFWGTLVSILNFKLLAKYVVKKASQSSGKLFLRITSGYLLRYGLMALVLIIAAKKGIYYFIGAALGLFAIRLAIFIDTFFTRMLNGSRTDTD